MLIQMLIFDKIFLYQNGWEKQNEMDFNSPLLAPNQTKLTSVKGT